MKRIYTKHGMTGTKIWELWKAIRKRCNGGAGSTQLYRDKGITVCKEWDSASAFIEWAENAGYSHGLQIDRIDNRKGYSPENCRFVPPRENANNKDNTILLTHNGKTQSIWHWSLETGIKTHSIHTRIVRGWSHEKALTKSISPKTKTPIINTKTQEVFRTIKEAAESLGMKKATLRSMLVGRSPNKTPMQYQ
jgi:hypothetical protein